MICLISRTDNKVVKKLFSIRRYYAKNHKNVEYTLFPSKGKAEYNSNSFAHGILKAAGISISKAPGSWVPGWDNPIPKSYFGA